MENLFSNRPITALQQAELALNQFVQKTLDPAEPIWLFLTEQFSVAQILDIYVPLVGAFHHQLLVRLICSLSVINMLNSLIKWASPEYRPSWWVREYQDTLPNITMYQEQKSCETTAGFPSSHATAFTTFIYLVAIFFFSFCSRKMHISANCINLLTQLIVAFASVAMWVSRMYLASQFLHQCMIGSLAAICLLHVFDRNAAFFYTMGKKLSVAIVLFFGVVPLIVYFGMLHMEMDPHWSVRQAFKWCNDPSFLRHEASPVFVLARDLGYLMGVALSAPLYNRYENKSSFKKRCFSLLVIECLNAFARYGTPKSRGRMVFVSFEFTRNLMHSYMLLNVLSKIT